MKHIWMKTLALSLFGAIGIVGMASTANAAYPEKPIRLVVPFPPGGATDVLARMLGDKLSKSLKQPVIIDNKGGAAGIIGTDAVAKAAPDGYTILLTNTIHTTNPALYKKIPYNIDRDFTPIAIASDPTGIVLFVNSSVPATSVKELIALAKQKPNSVTYASPGVGTAMHLAAEMFNESAGIKTLHVPYRGMSQALNDVISGQVMMSFQAPGLVMPQVQAGKLRVLAQTGTTRLSTLPDVPTMEEAGLPGYTLAPWFGVFGPAKMPTDIVNLLNKEISSAMNEPDMREKLSQLGQNPPSMSRAAFATFVKAEEARAASAVKAAGIDLAIPD